MSEKPPYISQIATFVKHPQNYRWLLPLLALFIFFFGLRSCFSKSQRSENQYVIARDATWYPLHFYGKEKNILAFTDDLIFEIASRKNLKIHLTSANPGDLIEALDGPADGAFTVMTPDVNLQERYLFSEPYYNLGTVLVVETTSDVTSLADIAGKYIGMRRGSSVLFSLPNRPNFVVVYYDSLNMMLEDIVKDKIDGALVNQINAYTFTNAYYKGRLKVATPPLTQEGLRLITNLGRKETLLIQAFDEGLAEMKKDGSYAKLLEKWDLNDPTH